LDLPEWLVTTPATGVTAIQPVINALSEIQSEHTVMIPLMNDLARQVDAGDYLRVQINDGPRRVEVNEVALVTRRELHFGVTGVDHVKLRLLETGVNVNLAAPGVPQSLSVIGERRIVEAAWNPPVTGGGVASYELRYRVVGAATWTTETGLTSRFYTVTELSDETQYEVQVRARNASGASNWSGSQRATTTGAPVQRLAIPANFSATGIDGAANLGWDSVTGAAAYQYRYRPTSGGDWTEFAVAGALTAEATGLTNGTEYEFQVRALASNAARNSLWSVSQRTTPMAAPVSAPATPTGLAADAGALAFTASWDAVTGATAYSYRYRSGGGNWTTFSVGTRTSSEATGLTAGTEYEVQVRASNSAGDSAWSASVRVTPLAAAVRPSRPQNLADTPAATSLAVSWDAPATGSAPIVYDVQIKDGHGGGSGWRTVATDISARTYTITGLTAATDYRWRVRAENSEGDSGWWGKDATTAAVAATAPGVISGLTAIAQAETLALSWTAPATGGAPTYYEVRWRAGTSGSWSQAQRVTIGPTYAVTGLPASTSYQVEVRAGNTAGASAWTRGTFSTSAAAVTVGVAPTIAYTTRIGASYFYGITTSTTPSGYSRRYYEWRFYPAGADAPAWQRSDPDPASTWIVSTAAPSFILEARMVWRHTTTMAEAYSPVASVAGPPSASEQTQRSRALALDMQPVLLDGRFLFVDDSEEQP